MTPIAWLPAPVGLALEADEVHVWRAPLRPSARYRAVLARTLDSDERARAARFYFERDRVAFTTTRGVLRTLIGRYLAHPAEQVEFGYTGKGKPYLLTPPGHPISFNASHSGSFALLAFARDLEVGIDVEQRRPHRDLLSLAQISFSRHEYAVLRALPEQARSEAFFRGWSRKEAFIKATGEGISQLSAFDVSLAPGEPARLLRIDDASSAGRRWSLHDLPEVPDHSAALVVDAERVSIRCWDVFP